MVDTTISPIQDFTTVKEGVEDNLLSNVFSAGTEIVGAFSDAGKEKKKNVFLSDFETRQISLIDALDQGAPGVTSAITRSKLRANYTAAITEFPQLREDIEAAYSGILSRNGLGTVGQAVTPEEKRNQETLDEMNTRGLVPTEGFAGVQEQAEAVTIFRGALQAESELKIFTAGIAARQAEINLNASEQQAQDAELAQLSGNVIRTGASAERLRLTARLSEIRNSVGTDGYDLNQALKDMELEKLGFEQTVAELEALPGADSDLISALRKPIDSLFTMETQLADGTIDKNAYDKGVESAVALEKALLVGNPVIARITATSELVGQLPPTTLGILNTITMKSFNDAMLQGTLGKPSDTTVDDPEEAEGVKTYVDSIRNFMRGETDLSQTEQVELTGHVTGILEGITRFNQVHHDDPTTARYFMDFLASPEFASYIDEGSVPQEVVSSARNAILSTYDDTIEPLIRQKFLDDNIEFLTGDFAAEFTAAQRAAGGSTVAGEPSEVPSLPTTSVIQAIATTEGIHFRARAGIDGVEARQEAERKARELNREIGPAINTWVKGVAHISGSTDYEAVMSRAIQDLTGQAPEGLDIENLVSNQDASSTALDLVSRVIQQESAGNANAVNSDTGASGLMQVMQATARDPGFGVKPLAWEDRFDPAENVRFGTEYLQAMLDKFDGDQTRALVAYNWGPGNAEAWSGNMADLPAETRDYVNKILGGSSGTATPFSSEDEAMAAIDSGKLKEGDTVVIDGVTFRVEE